uniref:Uncharacterized protein n=1 Tax=Chenopodium quinoa TaxID=63459 RepID=A0A803MQV2_CHEQI
MQICSHEVASVLGIADTGIVIDLSKLKHCFIFPSYLSLLIRGEIPLFASDLRDSYVKMEIGTKEDEVIFQKRFTLFVKIKYQKVNSKLFELADDLEKVNSLNWPEIELGHLKKGLIESEAALAKPGKQHVWLFTRFAKAALDSSKPFFR